MVTGQDRGTKTSMKFGILFTSHPHVDKEPYPHREVHTRVTAEILEADRLGYDELAATTLLHGSPDTVIRRLQELREVTGITSLVLHYPPYYGVEKTLNSLRLFAEQVIPAFRAEAAA
jgi:alkanesulfonate monooxygenase SsuD/methylene tetrahydromethanopterin reductase-like flavin-dependent oxidoreductase (luciferase family)|tara:strand:- start:50 stop:403 length:354 start_codon:yes stop_codon:yes gene_type:complete